MLFGYLGNDQQIPTLLANMRWVID